MAETDEAEDKIEIVIYMNMQKEVITSVSSIVIDSPENLLVNELINYPEIDYDTQAGLLFKLAHQAIEKFKTYLDENKLMNVVQYHAVMVNMSFLALAMKYEYQNS